MASKVSKLELGLRLESLEGAAEWLNGPRTSWQTKGHPTLVHFWSISSETAKTNLSQVAALREHRKREGLRVIAIHVPQSEAEKDPRAVRDAVTQLHLTEPCALDNNSKISQGQEYLPAYFLFDPEGKLRRSETDAHGLEVIEDELDQMLAELRANNPFCATCELFLNKEALFCANCGSPLTLPGPGTHPYYEDHFNASLPTVRLVNPDPLLGYKIDGKYELVARLGEGGMSVVYRARRVHIGDDVAVKILTGKFVKDDAALARFRREARAAAMLRHPNVITIHDFGETDDVHAPAYIVMEFIRGTPLRELLHSEKRFSVERG